MTADYDELQQDIRRHRTHIGDDLAALRRRLSLRNIRETTTMERIEKSRSAITAASVIRGNPIPLAMIGLGVGWLVLARTGYDTGISSSNVASTLRHGADRTAQAARDTFYSASENVRHVAEEAVERVSETARSVGDTVASAASTGTGGTSPRAMASGVGHQLRRASHSFFDMVDQHPLVTGVMGLALGAAIGASIPGTRFENTWLGEAADDLSERAKDLAEDVVDRGSRAARAAAQAAADVAKDAMDAGKEAVDATKDAVKAETVKADAGKPDFGKSDFGKGNTAKGGKDDIASGHKPTESHGRPV
jgi:hypothetical protein